MSISSVRTLLSLDEFCSVMEVSPWLFNQLDQTLLGSATMHKVWFQNESMTPSTIARDTVANVILGAEEMLARELTYWPAPMAIEGEKIRYPRMYEASWLNGWYNEKGMLKDIRTQFGFIQQIGVEVISVIEAEAAIAFLDMDGDGKHDTFTTAAIATTVTDPDEIIVLFADADRSRFVDGDERTWQIRPVRVEIAAGFVTVSGPIWLVVDPDLQYRPNPVPLDPTDTAITYVQRIKLSRLYVDTTQPGSLVYEKVPCEDDAAPCDQYELACCFAPRGSTKIGRVIPTLSAGVCIPEYLDGRAPDAVKINYTSGYPLKPGGFGRMDVVHAQMVARLSVTMLPERAMVSNSETQIDHWRGFPTASDKNSLFTSPMDNASPFGLTRGGIWVWNKVLQMNERSMAGAIR